MHQLASKILQFFCGQGLLDTLAAGEADASKAGLRVVLSKDFSGSDRDVQSRFMDAMTLVTRYGKPDFFVTLTCNSYWDEIVAELLPGVQDRHPKINLMLLPGCITLSCWTFRIF